MEIEWYWDDEDEAWYFGDEGDGGGVFLENGQWVGNIVYGSAVYNYGPFASAEDGMHYVAEEYGDLNF